MVEVFRASGLFQLVKLGDFMAFRGIVVEQPIATQSAAASAVVHCLAGRSPKLGPSTLPSAGP